jgi:outer membrane receptor protein involved in Fe transport
MTHRVRGAFARLFALAVASAVVLGCAVTALAAQEATGKLEGSITDQGGAPIASAQVTLVGTAFGALTSERGYYFMNNVPAGVYTVRAKFIGYTASEMTGVRILGGQTITTNIKLTPSAVAIGPVLVEAAANPIVPRDQVTSKTSMTAADLHNLPVEDLRNVINLQPGVVESGNAKGVSIRGGRPGEAAVYVDGVLVRNTQRGRTPLKVGTNAVEEVSVTTGALSAEFGDAQSGVITNIIRAGNRRIQGAFSFQTDDIGLWNNVGYNRVEGSVSGPLLPHLTFFFGTTLNGQKSIDAPIHSDQDRLIFVPYGVDTVVHQPKTWSGTGALTDSTTIAIPKFVQYNGTCGEYGAARAATSPTAQDIRNNYGVECQGLRVPFSGNGDNTGTAKLQYSYGSGSSLSFTGLGSTIYTRSFPVRADSVNPPYSALYDPSDYVGNSTRSLAGILNWTQNLARSAERAMALDVHLSYQLDKNTTGPLTRESELGTRNPFGGFMLNPFHFIIDENTTHTIRIKDSVYTNVRYLDDIQIKCVQAGEGACQDNVPFSQAAGKGGDLASVMPYRMNPYGVEQSTRFPQWTSGLDNPVDLSREQRWEGRANFDWQLDRFNRIKLGGEYHLFDTQRYNMPNGMNSSFVLNAYHEKPTRFGAYIQDRLDLGDVVIVAGVRFDRYDPKALYPLVAGRISSVDTTQTPFDPYNPTANLIASQVHSAWSPRVQVSFPVTERTNFRLSYAHQVQVPDFDLMFRGINTDLNNSNRNQTFGRDLDFGKTIIFEFGIRHAFSGDMVLDISAYNKDKLSDVTARLISIPDPGLVNPSNPGVYGNGDFRVLSTADFGNVRGLDVRLERRFSNLFSGAVSYTLQFAKNTGSDPFSYTTLLGRQINNLTNETSAPPQAILPTDDNRTHNLTGSASLQLPDDWRHGTMVGSLLRNFGAFVTFRFSSGLAYTRVSPAEAGLNLFTRCGLECETVEPVNTSVLPWFKNVDLRLTKGVKVRRSEWTLFAEANNIFNFTNVLNLFTEVGDVVYKKYQDRYVSEQVKLLADEARLAGILTADSSVNFAALGGCGNWRGNNQPDTFASGPVDCVLLERAEARYGNGDGVFDRLEYTAAFTGWYNLANAPSIFYGTGRRIRIGAQLTF